jgi:D-glycero-alpha-D-manno-heptose-7-phosphate kinase
MNMSGGKQDQYAAAFGGVNFMEFYEHDKVIVNPLRIKVQVMQELAHSLVLYYTETSRLSSQIIEAQKKNVMSNNTNSVEAMHKIKEQAMLMKEALLKGELNQIGEIMDFGWRNKKKMAEGISNQWIDDVYEAALKSGATGGKVSGAGGGGFMFFYCPGNSRHKVIKTLESFGGQVKRYEFTDRGLNAWTI